MDCSEPTPRVNYEIMQRYVGRKVRMVCKVEEWSGDTLKASTCDGQTIFIKPKQGSQYDTAFVEIDGIVENNTTLQEESYTTFGDSFGTFSSSASPSPPLFFSFSFSLYFFFLSAHSLTLNYPSQ